MRWATLDDMSDIAGKRVLVRVDLNVPMRSGAVTDVTRLEAARATITELADRKAIILLLSHFGRPQGAKNPTQSLSLIVGALSRQIGREVMFIPECVGDAARDGIAVLSPGDVAVLENTRFHPGEENNDPDFADGLAAMGDFFVNDAFSVAHRAHASTVSLARRLPSYAGRAMEAELKALDAALGNPRRPLVAVVGGAKISSKIALLNNLATRVDHLIIGGGMANVFLAARGVDVGQSLCEAGLTDTANAILTVAEKAGCRVHLPYDVAVAQECVAHPSSLRIANVHEVAAHEMILDAGLASVEAFADVLAHCRTLIWNGPLGVFEVAPFDTATTALARTAAALTREGALISVGGGGDTVAALNHAGVAKDFSFVSTAGGAFLQWMEGSQLPGVEALMNCSGGPPA